MSIEEENEESFISFQVDAGLIERLGRELVGREETAVSELIKNAYDADATSVNLTFINSHLINGTLEISDNGLGMNFEQVRRGFMTISSTDKVHNPRSERYNRSKAGKKGIGRFATQRLGNKVTIITQKLADSQAVKLTIDWDLYNVDQNISAVRNPIEYIEKTKPEGTTLIIEGLREAWTDAAIKRVYRYVAELFQPDYLSTESQNQGLAHQHDETFKVSFYAEIDNLRTVVADPRTMLFDRAIAEIEGYVDGRGDGFYGVRSTSLDINDYAIPILPNGSDNEQFTYLRNIHFKAYYFIYNRTDYYSNISKLELRNIQSLSKEYGGIRLYRNGFRVLPYGEEKDDWLGLDIRYAGGSSFTNIPFSNKNLFGFVEVVDPDGTNFQETASREGLILNDALSELQDFVQSSLVAARGRIAEGITLIRKSKARNDSGDSVNDPEKVQDNFKKLEDFVNSEEPNQDKAEAQKLIGNLKVSYDHLIEELGMLRVLAGLGLTIAEFTHEVIQFTPSIYGYISALKQNNIDNPPTMQILENLTSVFNNFTAYTSYFNATVSQNVSRELKPIRLIDVVNSFHKTIADDLRKTNIDFKISIYDYELFTTPMHASEWSSILFNFYTNSKKAIKRASVAGEIEIILGTENEQIYLEFTDNGDGIAEEDQKRIFNAFFTTSTPVSYDSPQEEKLTGTGLGLKIVKDIIETYKGSVYLIPAEKGFSTCFRIDIPKATPKQKLDYGL